MVRHIFSWLWAIPALAKVQLHSIHPQGHDEITYSFNIPDNTAKSGSGPIYFQMNSTRQVQWFALGQGMQMAGANMFVVYTSGNTVTVSPRSGIGEIEPLYNKGAQITILNGSGVHDGVITANVRCDTCLKWNGGTETVTSSSSPWIWAIKYGESLNSVSLSEVITQHDDHGVTTIDLKKATGGNSMNPFAQMARAPISSSEEDPGFAAFRRTVKRKKTAHAVLMVLAFVVMFPFFALGLHIFPSKWTVNIHGTFQLLTLAVVIAGFGLGISLARQIELIDSYHTILGMIIVPCLVLFQPAMGVLQHRFFRKTGGKGPFAYMHRWFGRLMMILGVINVGLGFKLAQAPRGAVIATSVVAGIIAIVYIVIYLHRKSLHNKPTVHVTYDEGIQIVRQFLFYASKHPVEDLQAFTRQWAPSPHWVRTETITIPDEFLSSAADAVTKQLGPKGVTRVGGEKWWQWRGPSEELKGEWIEMRNHYNQTEGAGGHCNRVMLYVHGGAYFFGSVDTHRYMMQRHARKLKGRVFAPEYRLAPQFPFPCGLHDCMAAYLWLLKSYEPKEIILAGDSAGGGLALSMLVIMRDQGIPLPAGAILISPWVDLTHSFPSIIEENTGDYIPAYGFRHKPSPAWPPPNADDILEMKKISRQPIVTAEDVKKAIPQPNSTAEETAIRGYTVHESTPPPAEHVYPGHQQAPNPASLHAEPDNIHVVLDGKTVELKDQIQLYTTNQLMSHPLVSPVLQPSLGGLPPLQILSGGGETLRDEQFYIAHKAANPAAYPPSDVYLDENDPTRETLNKYEPTYVQLQVWDNLCHVAPTLSFTRPAKYMFRSISQFGSWALARAQNGEVEIVDDSALSAASSNSSEDEDVPEPQTALNSPPDAPGPSSVGKAGDPLPAFHQYMIRQRIDKRGHVFPLDPPSSYLVLKIPPARIGAINPLLIRMWLDAKKEWDIRFAKEKLRVQSRRLKELAHGFQDFDGECPPPSSLAARRAAPGVLPKRHAKKNYGMMMWSGWGSRHDERRMEMEKRAEESGRRSTRVSTDAGQAGAWSSTPATNPKTEKVPDKDLTNNKSQSNGYTAVSSDKKEQPSNCNSSTGRTSTDPETVSRPPSQISTGPILILPEVNNNKFTDENASTRALFHAAGSLPMKSDLSLAHSRYRPSSAAGSATGRSEMLSDTASTVGGDKDSVAYMNMASDTASTRAVIGARGIIAPIMAGENGRRSTDTLSVFSAAGRDSLSHRPEIPEREGFKSAE
ncbi:Alpha/beta hydrolase fold-3 [Penicillium expansum]|uniref:Alpha/beta hydrolase fold-3 n=1 Tax=Penicillium expansum TaxID=27334 RepID=A0A0A2KJI5_PENEN|nr:Alpha/beta hydrolase fold-3 [Penicillium expansum]KGO51808.1 Alpha/beta hydrolase fold-3 [Penicillium expansum]KGO67061.1 Alpha/beta hydrolase fold-3 [Penicillium expansum]